MSSGPSFPVQELLTACKKKNVHAAKRILTAHTLPGKPSRPTDHSVVLNARLRNNKDTFLTTAIKAGSLSLVRLLLAHRADVNLQDRLRYFPLHVAVLEEENAIAQCLIDNKVCGCRELPCYARRGVLCAACAAACAWVVLCVLCIVDDVSSLKCVLMYDIMNFDFECVLPCEYM